MANISVSLPADGDTIDSSDYNTPITTVVNEINGGLDNSNIATNAAIAGSKLADGISTTKLANPYKFRVYRNAAQNTVNGTTKILFDTKTYDTSTNFDVVTNNRFVAPVAGFYTFSATIQSVSTGNLQANLYKNGSLISSGINASGSGVNQGSIVTDTVQLAASDYVEVFVSTSAAVALFVGSTGVYFSGSLVSTT